MKTRAAAHPSPCVGEQLTLKLLACNLPIFISSSSYLCSDTVKMTYFVDDIVIYLKEKKEKIRNNCCIS